MSIKAHINSLRARHQQLEKEIHDAHTHHRSTTQLKKEKLHIKDEIQQLESRMIANMNVQNAA